MPVANLMAVGHQQKKICNYLFVGQTAYEL